MNRLDVGGSASTFARTEMRKILIRVALGTVLALALHLQQGGWWLNEGQRVRTTLGVVALTSLFFAPTIQLAAGFGVGVAAGKAGILFLIGPGTIFPIVIAVGTIFITGAVLIGFGVGWIGRLLLHLLMPLVRRTRRGSVS